MANAEGSRIPIGTIAAIVVVVVIIFSWASDRLKSPAQASPPVPSDSTVWREPPPAEKAAKEFHEQYLKAPKVFDKNKVLAGLKKAVVVVEISKDLCPGYDSGPLKTELELKLRQAGVKVVEKEADAIVVLVVNGFWRGSAEAIYNVQIDVTEEVHAIRGNQQVRLYPKIWVVGSLYSVGASQFPDAFLKSIATCENELLNDYLAANR